MVLSWRRRESLVFTKACKETNRTGHKDGMDSNRQDEEELSKIRGKLMCHKPSYTWRATVTAANELPNLFEQKHDP